MTSHRAHPNLDVLVALFFDDPSQLGEFDEVDATALPSPFDQLLAHHEHMTVTVEDFYRSPVDVLAQETRSTATHYARTSLLRTQRHGQIVQFGIVRLDLRFLEPQVREEILSQQIPLGRVLIEHNVLRQVELVSLWRVRCGVELARHFSRPEGTVTYGRTALIHCNDEPAVELLEIVAPPAR